MLIVSCNKNDRLCIEMVIKFVLTSKGSGLLTRCVFDELAESDAKIKKEMRAARVRTKLVSFCNDKGIFPSRIDGATESCCYEGEVGQDKEFDISIEEFKLFANAFGIDVVSDEKDFPWNQPQAEHQSSKPISIRLLPIIPQLSPSGEEIEDDWGSDIEEGLRADADRRKAQLKKQIPGKLPNTRIGKLVVKIAWEIEVDTDIPAATKAVMDRLCKLAENIEELDSTDSNEDYLIGVDTNGGGQKRVKWETSKGAEKLFGEQTCKQALRAWRNSLPQKRIRRR